MKQQGGREERQGRLSDGEWLNDRGGEGLGGSGGRDAGRATRSSPSSDLNSWPILLTHVSVAQAQDTAVAAAQHTTNDVSQDSRTHFGLHRGEQRESERLMIHAKNGHRIKGMERGGEGKELKQRRNRYWLPWAQIL